MRSLQEAAAEAIAGSSDPVRAAYFFSQLTERHGRYLDDLLAADRLNRLATVFSLSRFLSEELLRHPEWLASFAEPDRPFSVADYRVRLASFSGERSSHADTALRLALFRRKELARIVMRDGLGLASIPEVTEEISNLADAILDHALRAVTEDLRPRYGVPMSNGEAALFSVVALGKLGGRELNYSSDIDLMFLYSENGETTGPHVIANREFFKKVANQLTNLLSTYTAAGVCYRVDLRLRPEGSLGEVCVSLQGAKDYYAKRARDWELQMLIKARVAAGDVALGQELLDSVEPSIYSTTLDFSTIESMSVTRERMRERLARKRLKQDQLDVKLARGGIRDIEFLVQCLQRLHGAREASVRHGGTMFALCSLLDRDLLSETEHTRLVNAYEFLRNLEHRLQVEDDRQTHALPLDPMELDRLARRMPALSAGGQRIASGAQLLQILNQHLENVQVIYDRIVHAQRPLYYVPANTAVPNVSLPTSPGVPPESLPATDRRAVREAHRKLEDFESALPVGGKTARLLRSHAVVRRYAAEVFELSTFLSDQLARQPDLVEELRRIAENPAMRPVFESLAAPLNDIEGLRRFYRREMFRILAASVCLPESVFQTLDRTSGLAEFVIARAYRIALEQALAHAHAHATTGKPFQDPQEQLMVVALGRLGMREFDIGSDADLLFIIPDSESVRQRFWTRVAEHVIDILTAYGGDGPVLSLDTRLRPNGREGMLVQTESKYVEYFANHAEAWEGIAYMKARGVAGDLEGATNFLTRLQQVDWRRYGQSGRSKQDLRQMRIRLQREQGSNTPLKAGEGGYYDADFVLMYLRLKGAGMFFKSLNTPERIDIVEKMGHLERADAEFLLKATTFFRALDHAARVVTGRAEEKLPGSPEHRAMVASLLQRWTQERPTALTLDDELSALQRQMRGVFDRIFC